VYQNLGKGPNLRRPEKKAFEVGQAKQGESARKFPGGGRTEKNAVTGNRVGVQPREVAVKAGKRGGGVMELMGCLVRASNLREGQLGRKCLEKKSKIQPGASYVFHLGRCSLTRERDAPQGKPEGLGAELNKNKINVNCGTLELNELEANKNRHLEIGGALERSGCHKLKKKLISTGAVSSTKGVRNRVHKSGCPHKRSTLKGRGDAAFVLANLETGPALHLQSARMKGENTKKHAGGRGLKTTKLYAATSPVGLIWEKRGGKAYKMLAHRRSQKRVLRLSRLQDKEEKGAGTEKPS